MSCNQPMAPAPSSIQRASRRHRVRRKNAAFSTRLVVLQTTNEACACRAAWRAPARRRRRSRNRRQDERLRCEPPQITASESLRHQLTGPDASPGRRTAARVPGAVSGPRHSIHLAWHFCHASPCTQTRRCADPLFGAPSAGERRRVQSRALDGNRLSRAHSTIFPSFAKNAPTPCQLLRQAEKFETIDAFVD